MVGNNMPDDDNKNNSNTESKETPAALKEKAAFLDYKIKEILSIIANPENYDAKVLRENLATAKNYASAAKNLEQFLDPVSLSALKDAISNADKIIGQESSTSVTQQIATSADIVGNAEEQQRQEAQQRWDTAIEKGAKALTDFDSAKASFYENSGHFDTLSDFIKKRDKYKHFDDFSDDEVKKSLKNMKPDELQDIWAQKTADSAILSTVLNHMKKDHEKVKKTLHHLEEVIHESGESMLQEARLHKELHEHTHSHHHLMDRLKHLKHHNDPSVEEGGKFHGLFKKAEKHEELVQKHSEKVVEEKAMQTKEKAAAKELKTIDRVKKDATKELLTQKIGPDLKKVDAKIDEVAKEKQSTPENFFAAAKVEAAKQVDEAKMKDNDIKRMTQEILENREDLLILCNLKNFEGNNKQLIDAIKQSKAFEDEDIKQTVTKMEENLSKINVQERNNGKAMIKEPATTVHQAKGEGKQVVTSLQNSIDTKNQDKENNPGKNDKTNFAEKEKDKKKTPPGKPNPDKGGRGQ